MNTLRNSVQLIGHLGKDLELKTSSNGNKFVNFTLATNDYYKNNKGELMKETQWHNLVAWGKTAEYMNQNLRKGNEIIVQGKLVHRSYEDKDGNTRYTSEVKINEFIKISKDVKEAVPF